MKTSIEALDKKSVLVQLKGLEQAADVVGADGDKVDTGLLESIHLGGEGTELFDAVSAAFLPR